MMTPPNLYESGLLAIKFTATFVLRHRHRQMLQLGAKDINLVRNGLKTALQCAILLLLRNVIVRYGLCFFSGSSSMGFVCGAFISCCEGV